MPLKIIVNLVKITDDMSAKEKINVEMANKTVENVAKILKDSPMNQYDKGDRKILYTLTAHADKAFTKHVEIIPIK